LAAEPAFRPAGALFGQADVFQAASAASWFVDIDSVRPRDHQFRMHGAAALEPTALVALKLKGAGCAVDYGIVYLDHRSLVQADAAVEY
jgi:hypothetical protein